MCSPAGVVDRFGHDVAERFLIPYSYNVPGQGGVYLGSVGDQRHSVKRSSHNCAAAPGGQESPVNGVSYDPDHAHAWDCRPVNSDVGYALVAATLADRRVRYVLYADHGWYPDGTFEDITDNDQFDLDHDTFHVSFLPGTTNDTRPFFTDADPGVDFTMADIKQLLDAEQDTRKLVLQGFGQVLRLQERTLRAEFVTRQRLEDAGVIEDPSDAEKTEIKNAEKAAGEAAAEFEAELAKTKSGD